MCRSLEFSKRGKNSTEKLIFYGLANFAKKRFSEKNLWELLDTGVLHIFESAKKFRFF
jgi:hypothetical protein